MWTTIGRFESILTTKPRPSADQQIFNERVLFSRINCVDSIHTGKKNQYLCIFIIIRDINLIIYMTTILKTMHLR